MAYKFLPNILLVLVFADIDKIPIMLRQFVFYNTTCLF